MEALGDYHTEWCKSDRERQKYSFYAESKKTIYIYICINEIIYKTDSQTLKMNLWLPVGKSGGEE